MSGRSCADALLERGTPGLRYLRSIAPGEADGPVERYWTHRRLDLAGMHSDAESLRAAAAVMRAHLLAQEQAVARLTGGWAGDAAEAALAALDRGLDRARADCAAVGAAAEMLDGAAELVGDTLAAQADLVGRLGAPMAAPVGGVDALWVREALVPHVRSCLSALTRLLDVVDVVVEGAQHAVAQVVGEMGAEEAAASSAPLADAPAPVVDAPTPAVEVPAPAVEVPEPLDGSPVPVAAVPVAETPASDRGDPSGTLGFGPGSTTRRDRSRDGAPPAPVSSGESATGAELADAGPL